MELLFTTIMAAILIVVLTIPVALRLWSNYKCTRRIRIWADEHGYAVIRLKYTYPLGVVGAVLTVTVGAFLIMLMSRLFSFFYAVAAGLLILSAIPWGSWFVEVQDEQGGIRHGYVHLVARLIPHWIDIPWGEIQVEWQ